MRTEKLNHIRASVNASDESTRHRVWLTVGSLAALLIPLAVSPIWSRIYPVEYFAVSAVVQSVPGLIATWATLAYHAAVQTPKEEREALLLTGLSLTLTVGIGLLLTVVIVFGRDWIAIDVLRQPTASRWLWFAPLLLVANAGRLALDQWMVRRGQFQRLGVALVATSCFTALVPAFGVRDPDRMNFLLLGTVVGSLAGAAWRLFASGIVDSWRAAAVRWSDLRATARRFINFPREVVPSSLITNVALLLPQIMIARYFDTETAGQYARAVVLVGLPMSVLGQPIAMVFAGRSALAYRERGDCRPEIRRTLRELGTTFIPIYVALVLVAPWLLPFVFGPEWDVAGRLAQPMMASMLCAAIGGPMGSVLLLGRLTKVNLAWQAAWLLLVFVSLRAGAATTSATGTLWLLAAANAVAYTSYIALAWRFGRVGTGATRSMIDEPKQHSLPLDSNAN